MSQAMSQSAAEVGQVGLDSAARGGPIDEAIFFNYLPFKV
jgi:hypothetical protein